ncbi:MAG: hypothetical protein RR497_03895 [Oscillospiraceae bacterium]
MFLLLSPPKYEASLTAGQIRGEAKKPCTAGTKRGEAKKPYTAGLKTKRG